MGQGERRGERGRERKRGGERGRERERGGERERERGGGEESGVVESRGIKEASNGIDTKYMCIAWVLSSIQIQ